jgi:hypothetical protein
MLDTLTNLVPVIAILGMAIFMTLERWDAVLRA